MPGVTASLRAGSAENSSRSSFSPASATSSRNPKTLVLRELEVADRLYCFFATVGRLAESGIVAREEAGAMDGRAALPPSADGRFFSSYTGFLVRGLARASARGPEAAVISIGSRLRRSTRSRYPAVRVGQFGGLGNPQESGLGLKREYQQPGPDRGLARRLEWCFNRVPRTSVGRLDQSRRSVGTRGVTIHPAPEDPRNQEARSHEISDRANDSFRHEGRCGSRHGVGTGDARCDAAPRQRPPVSC